MQSELVVAAAKTGAVVNIKHGQFIAPENMAKPVKKIEDSGNHQIILTERGYTFGYNDLIVDPRSLPVESDRLSRGLRRGSLDPQVRHPEQGTARRHAPVPRNARAFGVAAGVDGFFIEAHPNPPEALCDAASQYYLEDLERFMRPLIDIHNLVRSQTVH